MEQLAILTVVGSFSLGDTIGVIGALDVGERGRVGAVDTRVDGGISLKVDVEGRAACHRATAPLSTVAWVIGLEIIKSDIISIDHSSLKI